MPLGGIVGAMSLVRELAEQVAMRIVEGTQRVESTYRIQLHAGFTFRDAADIVPYLHDLGITHVYTSPCLAAATNSPHGYDLIDPSRLNPQLGGDEGYRQFIRALREHNMGHILDIVPNHMGIADGANRWWNDVLEHGAVSRYAQYFDIEWSRPPRNSLVGKVLLPVLDDHYGKVLECKQVQLEREGGCFFAVCQSRGYPLSPRSILTLLAGEIRPLERQLGPTHPDLLEYTGIVQSIARLPTNPATQEQVDARTQQWQIAQMRIAGLCQRNQQVAVQINAAIEAANQSVDRLDEILRQQNYRLAHWRVAATETNYRRFFDINELAALRTERLEVFEAVHALVLSLAARGTIVGFRIDHPDGLADPAGYFLRLQQHYLLACARDVMMHDPRYRSANLQEISDQLLPHLQEMLAGRGRWPLYVVAEKILGMDESLPTHWAVHGTSGYDVMVRLTALLIDPAGEQELEQTHRQFTAESRSFGEVVYEKKLMMLNESFGGEFQMLAAMLDRMAQSHRQWFDFGSVCLGEALRRVIASFPVYRSYLSEDRTDEFDARTVQAACIRAQTRSRDLDAGVFDLIRTCLVSKSLPNENSAGRMQRSEFVRRFQQLTAPVMAKAAEDTAFYCYNRLVSLNEVGGDPGRFGVAPRQMHRYLKQRQALWPYSLTPLSTHDAKRGEDVRARINVLSELPRLWRARVLRWHELNQPCQMTTNDGAAPSAADQYLIYQTLLGTWPADEELDEEYCGRITRYINKALREAKLRTCWTNPDSTYEHATQQFIMSILDDSRSGPFLRDFREFARQIAFYGMLNSMVQTVLKFTIPGVCDTYQGSESWNLSLVDPDNRRPVDYLQLGQSLRAAGNSSFPELLVHWTDGLWKIKLSHLLLRLRQRFPGLFTRGQYVPVLARGRRRKHVFAFARKQGSQQVWVIVGRLFASLCQADQLPRGDCWADTSLPAAESGQWRDLLTGLCHPAQHRLSLAQVFSHAPVSVLLHSARAPARTPSLKAENAFETPEAAFLCPVV